MSEKFRKKTCIEVVERTPCGGYLVQNEGNPSDRWVIDRETFESTYLPADQLQTIEEMGGVTVEDMIRDKARFGFGIALDMLKEGYKVAREGWNGKGMFIYMVKGSTIPRDALRREADKHISHECDEVVVNSHIDMKAADGSIVVGWLASQTDMLAEDWMIVE